MPSNKNQPERPRREPEIIPPGKDRPDRNSDRNAAWPPNYGYSQTRSTHRIYVSRIGPLGFAIFVLIIAMFGGVLLLALIGAALIWLPLLAVFAVIAGISALIRRL
jgi:hypothetical protein